MISGKILRDAIISGANNINNQRSRVDELNVFPVPDGDTGTNMGMTVGASVRELEALDDSCTVGEASKTAASAMLRGARGNSGVITSLLFRGFSKALEGKKEADVADIVAALKKGVEGAYKAVMKPTEGTILTVARVASDDVLHFHQVIGEDALAGVLGRELGLVGSGLAALNDGLAVEDLAHALKDDHDALAACIHNAGFLQHRQQVGGVLQRFLAGAQYHVPQGGDVGGIGGGSLLAGDHDHWRFRP